MSDLRNPEELEQDSWEDASTVPPAAVPIDVGMPDQEDEPPESEARRELRRQAAQGEDFNAADDEWCVAENPLIWDNLDDGMDDDDELGVIEVI